MRWQKVLQKQIMYFLSQWYRSRLAWQMKSTAELTPEEALDLYERNWRHVDIKNMSEKEKELITTLLNAFGREKLLV